MNRMIVALPEVALSSMEKFIERLTYYFAMSNENGMTDEEELLASALMFALQKTFVKIRNASMYMESEIDNYKASLHRALYKLGAGAEETAAIIDAAIVVSPDDLTEYASEMLDAYRKSWYY